MTLEQKYLLELLSAALRKTAPTPPEAPVDWNVIRSVAEEQKILPLIFEAVALLDKKYRPEAELMAKWEQETVSCLMFFAVQTQQFAEVFALAEKNGIDMLVLKGMALRNLYPVPELRTMSDCDIVIRKEQKQQTEELFVSCGYEVLKRYEGETVYGKKGALKFEVFHNLPSGLKSAGGKEIDVWKNTRPVVGTHIVKPSAENMLLHSVTHLVKHLRKRGAGIRNLADILLIMEKEKTDREYLSEQLKLLEAETIFYGLVRASEKYLGFTPDSECPEFDEKYIDRLMNYMMSNGVYGVMDNVFILDARSAEGKKWTRISNYMKKMFPAPRKLSDRYMYAKKCPILLPAAWIHRMFYIVFKRGNSVSDNLKSMQSASKTVDEQLEILEYFNIK